MTMARRFARGAQFQVCGIMNWLVLALEHMCHFLARFQKKKNWGKEIKEVFRRFCVSEGHLHANVVVVNYPVCMIVKQAYFIALCPKVTHLAKRYSTARKYGPIRSRPNRGFSACRGRGLDAQLPHVLAVTLGRSAAKPGFYLT